MVSEQNVGETGRDAYASSFSHLAIRHPPSYPHLPLHYHHARTYSNHYGSL